MEIKIGIRHLNRELSYDVDTPLEELEPTVREALASEDSVLTLTDAKHRTVVIPGRQIAYVELGTESARQVGFGTL